MKQIVKEIKRIPPEVVDLIVAINPYKVLTLYPHIDARSTGKYLVFPCPIHHGDDYNFKINLDNGYYACYSHGCVSGNNISFVMKMENCNFVTACKILGSLDGIEVKEGIIDPISFQKTRIKNYVNKYLDDNTNVNKVLQRRIPKKVYIPHNNGIDHPFIQEKRFLNSTLNDFGVYYNKKMNRVVFLIKDWNGNVVSWKARAITPEQKKIKKFASPADFVTGDFFYGEHMAWPHIISSRKLILVEGHWDVLRCFEEGYYNVLGVMGSYITDFQAQWIKNNVHTIYPAFDPDKGGEKAFVQSYLKLRNDINIFPIELPYGKDPDNLMGEEWERFNIAL